MKTKFSVQIKFFSILQQKIYMSMVIHWIFIYYVNITQ
jgi:hypothetical protein